MSTEVTGLEPTTPVKITSTSATERANFRRCRRQWFLNVVHRLSSVGGNENLWLGTLVHAGLQAYYEHLMTAGMDQILGAEEAGDARYLEAYEASLDPLEAELGWLWPNLEPTYFNLGQLGRDMLRAYFAREREYPIVDEVLAVEHRVNVPIKAPGSGRRVGWLSVQADLAGRRRGDLLVVDHKTASREASSAQLDLDDQLTAEVYSWWLATGDFPDFASYNVLMKKVAEPPRQLKPTKKEPVRLSRDVSQPTTYKLYLEEIRRLGLSVADYSEILLELEQRENEGETPFFRREEVFRTPAQMTSFEANLYEEWRDMRTVAAHPERAYPNPSAFSCPSCPVRVICTTMMDAGDSEAIIKAGYVVADPRR